MPKFYVKDTFVIEGRPCFVLAGSVVEGEIRAGMFAHIALNSAIATTARIDCIEFARRLGGHEDTCLCIRCADPDELKFWRALNISDETIEVTPHAADYNTLRKAIASAAQIFRAHPDSSEKDIFNRLLERGIERTVANQLIVLLPLAYGRVLLSDNRGVLFADTYIYEDDQSQADREYRLDALPLWTEAISFAKQNGEPFLAIASRSPEVRAVNAALQDGKKLEAPNLVCSPPVFLWPEFHAPAGSGQAAQKPRGWWQIWNAPAEHPLSHVDLTMARVAMVLAILVGLLALGVVGYYAITLWQASH